MRAPDRDRRGPLLAACCALLLIPAIAAALPAAEFAIAGNGTAFNATVELENTEFYSFNEPGILGEPIPIEVSGVCLTASNGTVVAHEDLGAGVIAFPEGNYTLTYSGPVRDNQLQQLFTTPYRANVTVPAGYGVTNPLLGGYSPGANVTALADNSTLVSWKATREVRVRFYDPARESLLWFFATTWAVIAVMLLFPFVMDRLSRRR